MIEVVTIIQPQPVVEVGIPGIQGPPGPPGVVTLPATIAASESLSAGDFVNIWSDAGTPKVRKADASTSGKEAVGFVLSAVTSGSQATVYTEWYIGASLYVLYVLV